MKTDNTQRNTMDHARSAFATAHDGSGTQTMNDSDKAYQAYCRRLEDGWKKNRPGAQAATRA
jgi:hypothetical protein